ncbi:MAG: ABC transporter permease [Phycisphaerales bacterium]
MAFKMLVGDRLKYAGLIAGIVFAVMLIAQQASIMTGFILRMGSFIRDTGSVDLWVMDPQRRFSDDLKPLSETALPRVRGIEGVSWAVPMYRSWLRCRLPDGTLVQAIVTGLDDATLLGGPPEMVEGRLSDLRRAGGVLIDADEINGKMRMTRGGDRPLVVGDRLAFNDEDAVVVGSFRASKGFFWEPVVYTTYSRALAFAPPERRVNAFVLVGVRPGVDPKAVAARIEGATGLSAMTSAEFESHSTNFLLNSTGILANFGLAIGLGFLIGVLVCGQTLYQFTLDNLRHFAALKAMGAGDWLLVRMVATQVLTVGAIGYGIGLGLAVLLGRVIVRAGLAFNMPWQIPVLAGGAIGLIGVMAGSLSLMRVIRAEPGMVFKG